MSAAKLLESSSDEVKAKLPEQFYDFLDKNKEAFILATTEEMPQLWQRGGRDSATKILRILKVTLKNTQQLTDDQELYLKKVMTQLEEGGLPKQTTKHTLKTLNSPKKEIEKILEFRMQFYNQADYTIDTSELTIEDVVEKILELIK